MSAFGGLVLTNRGRNLQAKAQAGVPLVYTRIGLGDGQLGTSSISELNNLKNQVRSLEIGKLKVMNSTTAVIGTVLNNSSITSGFYFREIGVFATDPDIGEILYCYGNARDLAEYIPPGGGSDIIEKMIDVQVLTGNATSISAVINSSLIFETPEGAQEKVDIALQEHKTDYLSHTGYAVATGSANAYIATLNPALSAYKEGVSLRLKINATNTGASTINVNSLGTKHIKKSNGNALAAGNLKLGSIYTLAYDGTSFILQGEGGEYGTATAGDVLNGVLFGTEEGVVNGTLALTGNATAAQVLAGQTFYNNNVKSKVTGTIPSKAAATIIPSTANQVIAAGQYLSGLQTILGDLDLLSANVIAGKNIFNVEGTATVESLGGRKRATGTVTPAESGGVFFIEQHGIAFSPSIIIARSNDMNPTTGNYAAVLYWKDFISNRYMSMGNSGTPYANLTEIGGTVYVTAIYPDGFRLMTGYYSNGPWTWLAFS